MLSTFGKVLEISTTVPNNFIVFIALPLVVIVVVVIVVFDVLLLSTIFANAIVVAIRLKSDRGAIDFLHRTENKRIG